MSVGSEGDLYMGIAARVLANQVTQIAIHFLRVESVELDEYIPGD